MKIIGLTGSFASGKSTVSEMIRDTGIHVVCADDLARKAVDPGKPAYEKIIHTFGREILKQDKTIDRAKLGSIVFSSEEKRKKLNSLVHPEVIREMKDRIVELKNRKEKIAVLDISLLYEENLNSLCDQVIVAYAPDELMLKRGLKRDDLSKEEIKQRIASQMSIEEKKKRADYVIDNSGTVEETREQVEKMLERWK